MRCVWCLDGQRTIYSTVLSGCMCACEDVCDIRLANRADAYQCYDTFRGAISALVQVSFHVHYFASYCYIT